MVRGLVLAADPSAAIPFVCCGLVFGIAIGAVILRAAVKWVVKIDLPFGPACGITVVNLVANWIVGFAIGLGFGAVVGVRATGRGPDPSQIFASLVSLPIQFMVSSLIYGAMIKAPKMGGVGSAGYGNVPSAGGPLEYESPRMGYPEPIGFGKGALVTLMMYAIGLAIAIVLVGVVVVVMLASGTRF